MRVIYLCAAVLVMAGLVGCQQENSAPEKSSVAVESMAETRVEAPAKPVAKMVEPVEKVVEKSAEAVKESVETAAPAEVVAEAVEAESAKPVMPVVAAPANVAEEAAVVEPAGESPAIAVPGDAVKGAKLAKGKCGACHHFDKDAKKVGPSLMGIFGRAPSIDGVPFTTWDMASLDQWIANPKAAKSNTKMAFKGIPEKAKRDDIIAYLKTL